MRLLDDKRYKLSQFLLNLLWVLWPVSLWWQDSTFDWRTAHFIQGRNAEIFGRRAKADDATLHRVFKWEWTRFLKKCKKNQEWTYGAEIFFTSRYNPRLNVKKISASYVHLWFFFQFFKNRSWNFFMFRRGLYLDVTKNFSSVRPFLIFLQFFKNSVHSHLNTRWSVASSAFARRLKISAFRPCVKWAVAQCRGNYLPLNFMEILFWTDFQNAHISRLQSYFTNPAGICKYCLQIPAG